MSLDIAELKRLAEDATPGPYKACSCGKCGLVWLADGERLLAAGSHVPDGLDCGECPTPGVKAGVRNASFIAAANPTTVLELLQRLTEAEESFESLQKIVKADPELTARFTLIRAAAEKELASR